MSLLGEMRDDYMSIEDRELWEELDPRGLLTPDDRITLNLIRNNKVEDLLLRLKSKPDCLSSLDLRGKTGIVGLVTLRATNREMNVLLGQLYEPRRRYGLQPGRVYSLLGNMADRAPGHEGRILSGHYCLSPEVLEAHLKFLDSRGRLILPWERGTEAEEMSSYSFYCTWYRKRTIFRHRQRDVRIQERKRELVGKVYSLFGSYLPETAVSIVVDFTGWAEDFKDPKNKVMKISYSAGEFLTILRYVKPELREAVSWYISTLETDGRITIDVNNMLI